MPFPRDQRMVRSFLTFNLIHERWEWNMHGQFRRLTLGVLPLLLMLCISGCATKSPWPSAPSFSAPPSECTKAGVRPCTTLYVSQDDLQREDTVRFGLLGMGAWVHVPPGQLLAAYGKRYTDEVLDVVNFNKEVKGSHALRLSLKSFEVSGISGQATLGLGAVLTKPSGEELLNKEYTAQGSSHFPLYRDEAEQRAQAEKSIKEAFRSAFEQLVEDIKRVPVIVTPAAAAPSAEASR